MAVPRHCICLFNEQTVIFHLSKFFTTRTNRQLAIEGRFLPSANQSQLEKITLPRIAVTPSPSSRRLGARRGRSMHHFGAGADMAVGKFDVHRRTDRHRRGSAQRPPRAIAHQRKTPRQDPAVGQRRQQLRIAFAARPAPVEEVVYGARGALGQHADALGLA